MIKHRELCTERGGQRSEGSSEDAGSPGQYLSTRKRAPGTLTQKMVLWKVKVKQLDKNSRLSGLVVCCADYGSKSDVAIVTMAVARFQIRRGLAFVQLFESATRMPNFLQGG